MLLLRAIWGELREETFRWKKGLTVSGQNLGILYEMEVGNGKKTQAGMKRRKSEKTFY